jgi:outer membrane protein OmpA-like peptidoglycan-associated protein
MHRRAFGLVALLALPLAAGCAQTGADRAALAAQPVRVVFFSDDSIATSDEAKAVIRDAAEAAKRFPGVPVRVLGFSAPEPGLAPTVALSRARAERVVNELVAAGVPRGQITQQGRGAVAFDAAPVESRRVEIHIGAN